MAVPPRTRSRKLAFPVALDNRKFVCLVPAAQQTCEVSHECVWPSLGMKNMLVKSGSIPEKQKTKTSDP